MKEDIIKSYIFIWYIDIGNIAPNDVPAYMEGAKHTLSAKSNLEDLLNGEVLEYFIPNRDKTSKLEVIEFNINSNKHFTKTSEIIEPGLVDAKEKITKIMNELNAVG